MIEIVSLVILLGVIGDMARRRGRHPSLFGLMLLVCWFGGELSSAALGFLLSGILGGEGPNFVLMYGLALFGAAAGAGLAFFWAASIAPVDGVWRDLASSPVRRSRLWGVLAGSLFGGLLGAVVTGAMYGGVQFDGSLPLVVQGFLAVGFVGGLLGLVSGLQSESALSGQETCRPKA